jgi:ATP/maltotriose-dependent transcriptional regulator MalT
MTRAIPALVSLLGSLGLACALAYLFMIFLAFGPGGDEIIDFLVGKSDRELSYGFLTVLIPYALLLTHLYARVRVGEWLLKRDAVEQAMRYASRRMKSTLLRARKEAIVHRSVVARVHLRRGEYDSAWEVLDEADKLPKRGPFLLRFRRWQLETALRRENLVDAHRVVDAVGTVRDRSADAAAFHACVAEIAVREGDEVSANAALDRADWAFDDHPRSRLVRALAAVEFDTGEITGAVEALDACDDWLSDVPGATAEVLATRALGLARSAQPEAARRALDRAEDATADDRSEWVVQRVTDELEGADGT